MQGRNNKCAIICISLNTCAVRDLTLLIRYRAARVLKSVEVLRCKNTKPYIST